MKKSPTAAVGALRDVVRRKSVGITFNSILARVSGGSLNDEEQSNTNENYDRDSTTATPSRNRRSRMRHDSYIEDDESLPLDSITPGPYVEPPEVPSPPPGGLLEAATKNVQGKLSEMMETYHEVSTSLDDSTIECNVYLTKSALYSDRLVILLGDSEGSPAGMWGQRLCVRSGSEGGGIFKGSLGSMLPYAVKAHKDKLGIIMYDDLFKGFVHPDGTIDMPKVIHRFITGWRNHVMNARATHVFIVAYRDGGKLLVEALRVHIREMQRHISGVAFIQSSHRIVQSDSYDLRKLIAQWCIAFVSSQDSFLTRIKPREYEVGCVVLSAGRVRPGRDSDVVVLQNVVDVVFASFKARWSGFRVKTVNSGMEKSCYLCKNPFNLRRWRRHCRTCQNPCCEKCTAVEQTRHEGQIRLCQICRALPSLIHWSRPRAVRMGEKESVFHGSAKPGKMSVADFELVTVIGRGACGKVLLVQKKAGPDAGHLYAMKVLKKDWVMNKDLVTQTMAERRILQEANHPYIVQLKYAFQNQDKLYMVMEYYSGGSLRQVLRRRGRFSIKRTRFYLAEILLAISHLHRNNILYRDLKLENIVITAEGNVACTDFGLSKEEMDDNERTSSFVGTCEYLAPELIMKEGYGKAVDWWAFGILAYEMIQGDSPFRHPNPTDLFQMILTDQPKFSDRFTPDAISLISGLLTKDPARRLGCGIEQANEIKKHAFFAEIDWDALLRKEMEVPRPPHRMEEVTDESHLSRAIVKMRDAREELMPDSPVSLPSSPSESGHFDRFSYHGQIDASWTPKMPTSRYADTVREFNDAIKEEDLYQDSPKVPYPDGPSSPSLEVDAAEEVQVFPAANHDGSLTDENSSPIPSNRTNPSPQGLVYESPPYDSPNSPGTPKLNSPIANGISRHFDKSTTNNNGSSEVASEHNSIVMSPNANGNSEPTSPHSEKLQPYSPRIDLLAEANGHRLSTSPQLSPKFDVSPNGINSQALGTPTNSHGSPNTVLVGSPQNISQTSAPGSSSMSENSEPASYAF